MAKKEIQVYKLTGNHENYDDMLNRKKREAAEQDPVGADGKPLKRGALQAHLDELTKQAMNEQMM